MVHVRSSDHLAARRPDIVTYLRMPGATHVGSWNADPNAYDRAVTGFLTRVMQPE
jgi:hypothetical protein